MSWSKLQKELNDCYKDLLAYSEENKHFFLLKSVGANEEKKNNRKSKIKQVTIEALEKKVNDYLKRNWLVRAWLRLTSNIKKKQAIVYFIRTQQLIHPLLSSTEGPDEDKLNHIRSLLKKYRKRISFFSSLKSVLQSLLTFFSQPSGLFSEEAASGSMNHLPPPPKRSVETSFGSDEDFNPRAGAAEERTIPFVPAANLESNGVLVAVGSSSVSPQEIMPARGTNLDNKIDVESLKARIKAFSRAQINKLCSLNVKLTQAELDIFCKECFSELSKLKHEVAFLHPDRNQEIDDDLSRALFDEIYSLFQEEKSMLLLLIENEQVMVTLFDLMDKQKQQSETFYKEMSQMRVEEGKKRDELFETYVAKFEKLRQEHKSDAEEMKKQRAADAEEMKKQRAADAEEMKKQRAADAEEMKKRRATDAEDMKKQREADQNELNRKLDDLESKVALLKKNNESDSKEASLSAVDMPAVSAEEEIEEDKKALMNHSSHGEGSADEDLEEDQIAEDQNKPKM